MKQISTITLSILLAACGGSSSSSNLSEGCSNQEFQRLNGWWESDFVRNGSNGKNYLEITEDCKYIEYQVGDHNVMAEWYADLEPGNYVFWQEKGHVILKSSVSAYTIDSFELSPTFLYNVDTKTVAQEWAMGSQGGEVKYTYDGTTFILQSIKAEEVGTVELNYEYTRTDWRPDFEL